jgi:hypothetical protein
MATASPVSSSARAIGFKRAKQTKFDDHIAKIMDATQVLGCQLLDEIIRDLQNEVSNYNFPTDISCVEFYSWLDNGGSKALGKVVSEYQNVLVGMGLGAVPDNMGDQLTIIRDDIVGVIRAAFNPVCSNPATTTMTKQVIQARLKQLEGLVCASKGAGGESSGTWPKFVKNDDGSTSVVTADGTTISMNLDNSADNSSNIANMYEGSGNGGSSKLDPNVLAALLLAAGNNKGGGYGGLETPMPSETLAPETLAPAVIDTSIIESIDLMPTQPPVQTIFGLGPIGITLVALLLIGILVAWWYLSKDKKAAAAAAAPLAAAVPTAAAPAAAPRNARLNSASKVFEGLSGMLKQE